MFETAGRLLFFDSWVFDIAGMFGFLPTRNTFRFPTSGDPFTGMRVGSASLNTQGKWNFRCLKERQGISHLVFEVTSTSSRSLKPENCVRLRFIWLIKNQEWPAVDLDHPLKPTPRSLLTSEPRQQLQLSSD